MQCTIARCAWVQYDGSIHTAGVSQNERVSARGKGGLTVGYVFDSLSTNSLESFVREMDYACCAVSLRPNVHTIHPIFPK